MQRLPRSSTPTLAGTLLVALLVAPASALACAMWRPPKIIEKVAAPLDVDRLLKDADEAELGGREREAIRLYERVMNARSAATGVRTRAALEAARLSERVGRFAEAAEDNRLAASLDEKNPKTLLLVASRLAALGEVEDARAHLSATLDLKADARALDATRLDIQRAEHVRAQALKRAQAAAREQQ